MTLSRTELDLLDRWQRDFPFVPRPFAVIGQSAGIDERATLKIFEKLQAQQMISRIGAVVKPHTVGASTLAAMRVAPERLEQVADIVSRQPLVSHNYQRTNAYNLWFVVAGPDLPAVSSTIASIEEMTDTPVLDLRLQQAYHLDLGFPLEGGPHRRGVQSRSGPEFQPDAVDRRLLAAIEDGLPIVPQPYDDVGSNIGLDEAGVIARLEQLTKFGVVTRFGCIVRHRQLGYTANAMAVWDVADDESDAIAAKLVSNPRVTLCYRRSRRLPDWRYNLYCMVHAKSQSDALAVIDELNAAADLGEAAQTVLFSTRCFKQRGAVFSDQNRRVQ